MAAAAVRERRGKGAVILRSDGTGTKSSVSSFEMSIIVVGNMQKEVSLGLLDLGFDNT